MRYLFLLFLLPRIACLAQARPGAAPGPKVAVEAPVVMPNLEQLWLVDAPPYQGQRHEGCFGKACQRLQVVFLFSRQSTRNPNVYYVQGKTMRADTVRRFKGEIVMKSVRFDPNPGKGPQREGTASGTFVLYDEPVAGRPAGSLRGKIAVHFKPEGKDNLVLSPQPGNAQTRGAGLLLEGDWTCPGRSRVPVMVMDGREIIGSEAMPDYYVNGDYLSINYKYNRLGWPTSEGTKFEDSENWWWLERGAPRR